MLGRFAIRTQRSIRAFSTVAVAAPPQHLKAPITPLTAVGANNVALPLAADKSFDQEFDQNLQLLFDCGVHLGHAKNKIKPQMKGYVFGTRHGRAIFDLRKTYVNLQRSTRFLNDIHKLNGRIVVVSTRPDISKLVYPLIPKNPLITFVGHKWPGGMITNWDELLNYAKEQTTIAWKDFSKMDILACQNENKSIEKEMISLLILHLMKTSSQPKQKRFLKTFLPFIEILMWDHLFSNEFNMDVNKDIKLPDLKELPSLVVLLHASDSEVPMTEAFQKGIPVIGVCDSDCAPHQKVQYCIPGNDDSLKAQYLYTRTLLYNIPNIKI